MKKYIPLLLVFISGFVVHMFLFSDLLPESLFPTTPSTIKKEQIGATIPTPQFGTSAIYIEYKNGSFRPKSAVSKVSNHILIRNMDPKEAMWLESDAEFLKTTRPYGLSEQVDITPKKDGTYIVKNKLHEGSQFTVIIKP